MLTKLSSLLFNIYQSVIKSKFIFTLDFITLVISEDWASLDMCSFFPGKFLSIYPLPIFSFSSTGISKNFSLIRKCSFCHLLQTVLPVQYVPLLIYGILNVERNILNYMQCICLSLWFYAMFRRTLPLQILISPTSPSTLCFHNSHLNLHWIAVYFGKNE